MSPAWTYPDCEQISETEAMMWILASMLRRVRTPAVVVEVQYGKDDVWRSTHLKRKNVEIIVKQVLTKYGITDPDVVQKIFDLVSNQKEY